MRSLPLVEGEIHIAGASPSPFLLFVSFSRLAEAKRAKEDFKQARNNDSEKEREKERERERERGREGVFFSFYFTRAEIATRFVVSTIGSRDAADTFRILRVRT
jgi:hypothetical protein